MWTIWKNFGTLVIDVFLPFCSCFRGVCPLPFWPCEVGIIVDPTCRNRVFVPFGMSYQQSWNDQRGTYQSSYQRYQGSGFKPSFNGYRQGWGSQAQSSQPGLAMRLEIVQGTRNAKSASQQEEWDWRSWKKSKKGKKSKKDSSSSGTESSYTAPNRLRARNKGRRNGRSKGEESQRKTRNQEKAAVRAPSDLRMTRRRERCEQRTKEASCS